MNRLKLHNTILEYLTSDEAAPLLLNQDYRSVSHKLTDTILKDHFGEVVS